MTENSFVDQRWPIEGGHIRLIVESDRPIPPRYWGEIGSVVEAVEVAAAARPVPERLDADR